MKELLCAALCAWLLVLVVGAATAQITPAPPPFGPRLTDQDLLAAWDLSVKGLGNVKKAADAGDTAGAKRALAVYLRTRTNVPWGQRSGRIDPNARYDPQAAEDAVAGRVVVVTIPYAFPNGDIDWGYNATLHDPKLAANNEWQWQLGRMSFWGALGAAYAHTGDTRYVNAFARQMRSWVTTRPEPAKLDNGAGSSWRTIEGGIRLAGSWLGAYDRFVRAPALSDDDLLLFVKSWIEQARYLRRYQTGGNWLTMEMNGLYTAGALFPELKEAADWRRYAAKRLYDDSQVQFLPDGAQYELTPGYHNVALDNVLGIAKTAQKVGRLAELPPDYVARLERAYDYDLYLMTPNRSLPRFNDSWDVDMPRILAAAVPLYPTRPDFQWVATDGKQGTPPRETSRAFPWAGYYAMRSGWGRDANLLVLDAGPLGNGHVHQDKLNVVVWAGGRELLFDGGGGSYERSRWRSYGTDTFSHNTILVDGQPQRRDERATADKVSKQPIDAHWQSDAAHDYAEGLYDENYGKARPATHRRRVLFVKPDIYVVSDTLTPTDAASHTYQARWHLLTTQTGEDAATQAVTTTDANQPNLAVIPLRPDGLQVRSASAQTEPELLGWWVRKDLDPPHIPATTVLHTRTGTGAQHFLTLLLPLPPDASNPVRQVSQIDLDTVEVTLTDGRRLRITDSTSRLGFVETLANGKPGRRAASP